MPMGIVSDAEFDREIQDSSRERASVPTPIPKYTIIDMNKKGRKEGDVNVPENLRKIIGETAVIDGPNSASELAKSFGLSQSSASAYANGSRSTATYSETPDRKNIVNAKTKITSRAMHKVMAAMKHITDEKLSGAKARDLAAIAKDMSVVAKNMTGEGDNGDKALPQILFYAPQFRDERSYETIVVKEDF